MIQEISHLCWDFDGTLYNSYTQMTRSMLYALSDLGVYISPAETYALMKVSVYHVCHVVCDRFGLPTQRVLDAFRKHNQAEANWPLYAGTDVCLYQLRRLGCKHYLYTRRDRKAVRQLYADDLAEYFTDFITREDGLPDKPAPDALLYLCKKHGIDAKKAVMIGDRDIDVLAGQGAGMRTILFDPGGFYPDLQADYRLGTMQEILGLVKASRP